MNTWTYKSPSKHVNRIFKKAVHLKKEFPCACGRKFSHEKNRRYHLKWECGKVLFCAVCSTEFASRSRLVCHQRVCAMERRNYGNDINFDNFYT